MTYANNLLAKLIEKLKEYLPEFKKKETDYKRGQTFEGSVTNVGEYFIFQNRECGLQQMRDHLSSYLKWCNDYRGTKESIKSCYFLFCAGAPGIGKTSFVEHSLYEMLKEDSPSKAELSLVLKHSREYPIFYLNFNSVPLYYQKEGISIVAACMAYEIYHTYNQNCSLDEFIKDYQEELKQFSINTIAKLLETNTKGKYFLFLHLDDVQKLFPSKEQEISIDNKQDTYYYRIINEIFMAANLSSSNHYLVPVLSGTSAIGIHQAFSKSGLNYRSISLELLKQNHFINIMNGLYGYQLEIPEKFLELVDLLVGHPRLFTLTISLASQIEEVINSQLTGNTEKKEINLKFKEKTYEFPDFDKQGFLKFLHQLS